MVLQIGESLLKERLPKSFKQDVVLAMSLAYVDLSRDAMALSPPDFVRGSELLERALKLLQVKLDGNMRFKYYPAQFILISKIWYLVAVILSLALENLDLSFSENNLAFYGTFFPPFN